MEEGPASGLAERWSASSIGSNMTSLTRFALVLGDVPSSVGLASSLSNSNSRTSSSVSRSLSGLRLRSGLGEFSSSDTSSRWSTSRDKPMPESSATTLLINFLSYLISSLCPYGNNIVTDLTIFNSRRFPVFGKRRIIQNRLELFSVLHFRVSSGC